MPNRHSSQGLTMKISQLRNFLQKDAKVIVKTEGVNHFKQSFINEGFTDNTLTPWPDVSEQRKAQKRKKNGSLPPILTDTGDLGNSVSGKIEGRDIVFGSDLSYSQRHNEGLNGMPKRQFIGESQVLNRRIEQQLKKGIGRIIGKL